MNRIALWLCVPALLLLAALGIAQLVCRVCDAVEQPESPRVEPRSAEEEFAAIVATRLADLQSRWADPS